MDTEIASNLREPITVTVAVENGDDVPLQIQSVTLEMRQRTMCFTMPRRARAMCCATETPLCTAPVYDYARLFQPQTNVPRAAGPEGGMRTIILGSDERRDMERHPG